MSMNSGPSRSLGTATQMGFVPSLGSLPPNGATFLVVLPESAVIRPIMPSRIAISG